MRQPLLAVLPILALGVAGCSVGPNYHPPSPAMPGQWSGTGTEGTTNAPAQLAAWWKNFGDPELDSLIRRAVTTNYTLQAAVARVRAARALRGAALADFLPTVDFQASYTTARRSANALAFPVRLLDTDTYQADFDASWEIDVFGGQRRSLEAANAALAVTVEDLRSVQVSLLAEVANNYIQARGFQRRIEIARQNLQAQQETVEITQLRLKTGLASELDVAQAKTVLANTQAQVPPLETSLKQAIFSLSVLLGQPPGALLAELSQTKRIPPTPPSVPVGLPSDLLLRRPDVRSSERQLATATAQIGVATAELFPKFSLTGLAGYQSLNAQNLISPGSEFWSAGPVVRWRLLEYPRLRAAIRSQSALADQALAQYHQTVLTALQDVENALVAYDREQERQRALSEAAHNSRRSLDLSNELYTKGVGDFINVLLAQRALYQAEDQLVLSQQTISTDLVSLYKALGGGWESEPPKQ